MRGADVSSDHHLLMTTMRLRLKRFTISNSTRTKYNVGLLRDKNTQAAFQISLSSSQTRAAKARAQEEYMVVDREVKRSIKKDKRDYIDDLARQAETAAGQLNMRDLYLVTKKLMGKFQQTDKPVSDKNGNPLTTTSTQLKRWAEHFRKLLNGPHS